MFLIAVAAHVVQEVAIRRWLVGLFALTLFGLINTMVGPMVWDATTPNQIFKPTFAKRAQTMPVSDAELVWFPLLLAFICFLVPWGLFVFSTVDPLHISITPFSFFHKEAISSLAYPICFMAAWVSLAVLSQWEFGFVMFLVMLGLGGGLFVFAGDVSEAVVEQFALPVTLASIVGSFIACTRARHGFEASAATKFLNKIGQAISRRKTSARPPFRSPWLAQLWFERGPYLWPIILVPVAVLPFLAAFTAFSASVFRQGDLLSGVDRSLFTPTMFWNIRLIYFIGLGPFMTVIPGFIVSAGGLPFYEMHKADKLALRNASLDRLSAIRPISTCRIVGTRLALNALAAVLVSFGLLYWIKSLLNVPAIEGDRQGSFYELFSLHMGRRVELCVALVILFMPVVVWSITCPNPLRYYFGRWWRSAAGFILFEGVSMSSIFLSYMKDHRSVNERLVQLLPGLVVCFLLAKVLLGVKGWRRLRETSLVSAVNLRHWALIWSGVAAAFIGAFSYALAPLTTPLVVTVIILAILPVNRIIWQVIGLDRTRHVANG